MMIKYSSKAIDNTTPSQKKKYRILKGETIEMDSLISNAISMGILSGIWFKVSLTIGVATWAGFMGTTSYYASGERFLKGWKRGIIANMSGVFWAIVCIEGSKFIHIPNSAAIMTAIISFFIVAQAKIKLLSFIPGAFVGCATTFGMNGNYTATIAALLMGSVVGIASDVGGVLIEKLTKKKENSVIKKEVLEVE